MKDRAVCSLRERRTRFIEIFRTTPAATVCPNFYVLAHANGCAFTPQCNYCYLKSSFWFLKKPEAFANVDRILDEVRQWIACDRLESFVLNSGNLSDSLSFEGVRPLMADLVETFRLCARHRPHTLLLVSKGGMRECGPLLAVAPCENVVVSFSVNDPEVARRYERGAAAVDDRLGAAAELKKRGWRIRMRIDPMIAGFDYTGVVRALQKLRPERVTLGTLRAEANLWRHVTNGLFKGLERPSQPCGLARYPLCERLALYRPAVEAVRRLCPVGLCEEESRVWDALGLDADSKLCNCCA